MNPYLLFTALLLSGAPGVARAIETEVSTGIFYYPSGTEKQKHAQVENAEEGLRFAAPRSSSDVARELADEELRSGNVCLRQLRRDLRVSLKQWRVRDLCEKIFHDGVERALHDAGRAKLHPDHVECHADTVAREAGGSIELSLTFRAQLVMRERAPAKLRGAGIGADLTRWDLAPLTESLGSADGSWKDALRAGACAADEKALQRFWDKVQARASFARELSECRNGTARDAEKIARLQHQLDAYVPEDWARERAGDAYPSLMKKVDSAEPGGLAACSERRNAVRKQLEDLEGLTGRIADKYEIPALRPQGAARSPASEAAGMEEEE